MIRERSRRVTCSKWFLPAFSLGVGIVALVAFWLGGQPGAGVISLVIVACFGSVVLLGGRSETIRGLRGDGRDERFAQIDLRATAFAGLAVLSALVVSWLVEIARGHNGNPYGWLCAIGGLAYVLAVAVLRWRG